MGGIIKRVLAPVVERVGTMLSVALVAQGIPENTAAQVATGLGVVAGVLVDVIIHRLNKARRT